MKKISTLLFAFGISVSFSYGQVPSKAITHSIFNREDSIVCSVNAAADSTQDVKKNEKGKKVRRGGKRHDESIPPKNIGDSLLIVRIDSLEQENRLLNNSYEQLFKEKEDLIKENEDLRKNNNILQQSIKNLKTKQPKGPTPAESELIKQFSNNLRGERAFYCRAVMESPFFDSYSFDNVQHSLQLADIIGFSNPKHEFHWVYNIYIDLLHNYDKYTQELVDNIDKVIMQFDLPRFDAHSELSYFNSRLAASQYYAVRGKGSRQEAPLRHIYYLDMQIAQLQSLFSDKTKCNKKEFEKIRGYLLGE